jgi:UDP-N-acetylglucosamine 2-epimerase
VIDVGYGQYEIKSGIAKALNAEFRQSLDGMANPYGSGDAGPKIVRKLKEIQLDQRLLTKVS